MLASDSGSVLRPIPTPYPTRSLFRPCCFDPGSRPAAPNLTLKMELLRRMGRGCFKADAVDARGRDLFDTRNRDLFDATVAASPNSVPRHLVIMVNGIIGR